MINNNSHVFMARRGHDLSGVGKCSVFHRYKRYGRLLSDRTNGRTIGTVLRLSSSSSVCNV